MPPKKISEDNTKKNPEDNTKKSPEDNTSKLEEAMALLTVQQAKMSETMDAILSTMNTTNDRISKLEEILEITKAENVELRTALVKRDGEVEHLRAKLQALEAHNRSFSVRVTKLTIAGDDNDNENVRQQLYTHVFLPILQGAVQNNIRKSIPNVEQLIETAHVLPGRPGEPRPIICRFFSRVHKGLIMSLKKDFAPRETDAGRAGVAARNGRPPPSKYPIYEDLTREAFQKMKEISNDSRVLSCWSVGGLLRYRLKNDPSVVLKVKSIFDPLAMILG